MRLKVLIVPSRLLDLAGSYDIGWNDARDLYQTILDVGTNVPELDHRLVKSYKMPLVFVQLAIEIAKEHA